MWRSRSTFPDTGDRGLASRPSEERFPRPPVKGIGSSRAPRAAYVRVAFTLLLAGTTVGGVLADELTPEERRRIEEESCLAGRYPPWLDDATMRQATESDKLARSVARGLSPLAKLPSQAHEIQAQRSAFKRSCNDLKRARKAQEHPARSTPRTPAAAGCTRDLECKGDRICEQGVCTEPPLRRAASGTSTQ